MKKDQKKIEKKVYDFSKVMIEERFDEFIEVDLSKALGNSIHQNTIDIGIDEIARAIYHNGKAEIPEEQKKEIIAIVKSDSCRLLVAAKNAVIKLLTSK